MMKTPHPITGEIQVVNIFSKQMLFIFFFFSSKVKNTNKLIQQQVSTLYFSHTAPD